MIQTSKLHYLLQQLALIIIVTLTISVVNANGNRTSQTDANGNVTRWAYDNANRMISRTLPNGEIEQFTYSNGTLATRTDFNGKLTRYSSDANGRPAFATDANYNTVQTTYTTSGQVATVTDSRGVTRYTYDSQDRLIKQENPDKSFLAYAYDAAGNITERSTASGTVKYAFDKLNRLVSVTDPQNKVTQYQYDANGNRVKTINANGTEANYTYDSLNRLTNLEHKQTATGVVLRGYAYTLKPNGQRSQIREYDKDGTLRTLDYAYDTLNRLVQEKSLEARSATLPKTVDYVYGKTGNRSSKTETQGTSVITVTYTYDANDRLTQEVQSQGGASQTTTYGWDANGNMMQKVVGGVTTNYGWDSNNRLVEVKRNGASVATYQYDANGNRVGKTTADGTQISYLVDSNMPFAQVVEEKSNAGTTSYLYGLERIQQSSNGQASYYHRDGLGSTRGLSDVSGSLTDAYDYEAYGTVTAKTGSSKNVFLFAGEQFDAEAGWYYNRARYLDVNAGRFTGLDPFSGRPHSPISLNKYIYGSADPVNLTDPSGLMSLVEGAAAQSMGASLSQALTIGSNVLNAYSKAKSIVDIVMAVQQILVFIDTGGNNGVFDSIKPKNFPPKIDFSEAANVFSRDSKKAIGIGFSDWLAGYVKDIPKYKSPSAYVIYLPSLSPAKISKFKTGIAINGKPLMAGFGGPNNKTGALLGVGLVMGSEMVLYRMDIGKGNPGHIQKGSEISIFDATGGEAFSFHVYGWKKKGIQ